jgi:regulator of nucleoside diphosphate kinase
MSDRTIHITEHDMRRLKQLLFEYGDQYLDRLKKELERACIVSSEDVSEDVITMGSRVIVIDLDTGEETTYTLVFPQDADARMGRISVLAPVGTALLGYRVGDAFEWEVPAGIRRLKVKEILHQQRTAGNYRS